jgi:hypothetical protein
MRMRVLEADTAPHFEILKHVGYDIAEERHLLPLKLLLKSDIPSYLGFS